jgi:hypothetical protein
MSMVVMSWDKNGKLKVEGDEPLKAALVKGAKREFGNDILAHECNHIDCDQPGVIRDGDFWLCEDHTEEVY